MLFAFNFLIIPNLPKPLQAGWVLLEKNIFFYLPRFESSLHSTRDRSANQYTMAEEQPQNISAKSFANACAAQMCTVKATSFSSSCYYNCK
jgi:hypothetical protein